VTDMDVTGMGGVRGVEWGSAEETTAAGSNPEEGTAEDCESGAEVEEER